MNFLCKIFLFLLLIAAAHPQNEKVIARVGDYLIYESEFKDRFDFSAKPNLLKSNDRSAAKVEFLKKLIAEKLLSLEAREKGFHSSQTYIDIITPLQNMFIRDALYTSEIKNKSILQNDDINEGIRRVNKILVLKFIFSVSKEEIQKIYTLLHTGASFDSLLSFRNEVISNPKEITFGSLSKEIEDVIYSLNPGDFTLPLESEDGYYVMKLVEVKENAALQDRDKLYEDVKRIVETRAEYKSYTSYYREFFKDKKVTADKVQFEKVVNFLIPKFYEKYAAPDTGKYFLRGSEITAGFENKLSGNDVFIKFSKNPVRIKYFLNQLSHDGLYVTQPDEKSIRSALSAYLRKFIEDQLLTNEGIKKGFDQTKEVKASLRMWEDSYLSKFLTGSIFDSVEISEKELRNFYEHEKIAGSGSELFNIIEILTDSLQVIEEVINKLSQGEDFSSLAARYTKRDTLKEKGGEFGYFSVNQFEEIGKIAANMNIGDLYGPVKTADGYSIFKLIDRKKDKSFEEKDFTEVSKELQTYLRLSKFEVYLNEYTAKLAEKYGVEIFNDALESINNIFLNLVVVRYMGFGGELFAVPYTEQFPGWFDIWQQNKNLAP